MIFENDIKPKMLDLKKETVVYQIWTDSYFFLKGDPVGSKLFWKLNLYRNTGALPELLIYIMLDQ